MTSDSETEKPITATQVKLKLEHYIPADLTAHFVDNMLVTKTEGSVWVLSFMQSEIPMASSPAELEALGTIRSKCVARVILTDEKFNAFVDLMNQQRKQ
jgi:hypothetical protein